jgi:TATA-binding protein-associated factor Taf7
MAGKARESVSQLSAALLLVDGATEGLVDRKRSELSKSLSALEDAKLSVALAYSAASLFYVLQNVSGGEGDGGSTHGVQRELKGIKDYVAKIKQIEAELEKCKSEGKDVTINSDNRRGSREEESEEGEEEEEDGEEEDGEEEDGEEEQEEDGRRKNSVKGNVPVAGKAQAKPPAIKKQPNAAPAAAAPQRKAEQGQGSKNNNKKPRPY